MISIDLGDITILDCDAIVNAANKTLLGAFAPARTAVHAYNVKLQPAAHKPRPVQSKLTVHCDSVGTVNAALQAGAERILFGGDCFNHQLPSEADYVKVAELCRKAGRELALATPRIIKEAQLGYFAKLFALWQELQPDYVYRGSVDSVSVRSVWDIR